MITGSVKMKKKKPKKRTPPKKPDTIPRAKLMQTGSK